MTRTLAFAVTANQMTGPRDVQNDAYFHGEYWATVADGAGFHAQARATADVVVDHYAQIAQTVASTLVPDALLSAPADIARKLAAANVTAASTAVVAILDESDRLWLTSIGDSRIVVIRNGDILYTNHLHNARAETRLLQPEVDPPFGSESHLTRCLASDAGFPPDVAVVAPHIGDQIILLSDGIDGILSLTAIRDASLLGNGAPIAVSEQILQAALSHTLTDNATCVVARVVGKSAESQ